MRFLCRRLEQGVRDISQIISVRFVYTIGGNKYVNVIYVYYSYYFYSRLDTPVARPVSQTKLMILLTVKNLHQL